MVMGDVMLPNDADMRFLAELQRRWDSTGKPVTAKSMQEAFPHLSVAQVAKKLENLSRQQHCAKGMPSQLEIARAHGLIAPTPQIPTGGPPGTGRVTFNRGVGTGVEPGTFQQEHEKQPNLVPGLRYVPEKIIHTKLDGSKDIYCFDGHSYVNTCDFGVGHHVRLHGFNHPELVKFNGQMAMVVRTREENTNGKYTIVCEYTDKETNQTDKIPLDVSHQNLAPPWTGSTADELARGQPDVNNPTCGFKEFSEAMVPETRLINPDLPKHEDGEAYKTKPWDAGWKFYMTFPEFEKYKQNRRDAEARIEQENMQHYFNQHNMQHAPQQKEQGDAIDEGLDFVASMFGLAEYQQEEFQHADEDLRVTDGFAVAEDMASDIVIPPPAGPDGTAAKWFSSLFEGDEIQPQSDYTLHATEGDSRLKPSSGSQRPGEYTYSS